MGWRESTSFIRSSCINFVLKPLMRLAFWSLVRFWRFWTLWVFAKACAAEIGQKILCVVRVWNGVFIVLVGAKVVVRVPLDGKGNLLLFEKSVNRRDV